MTHVFKSLAAVAHGRSGMVYGFSMCLRQAVQWQRSNLMHCLPVWIQNFFLNMVKVALVLSMKQFDTCIYDDE